MQLLAGARAGRIADIARLVSIVENEEPEAADVVRATYAHTGRARCSSGSRDRRGPEKALSFLH